MENGFLGHDGVPVHNRHTSGARLCVCVYNIYMCVYVHIYDQLCHAVSYTTALTGS